MAVVYLQPTFFDTISGETFWDDSMRVGESADAANVNLLQWIADEGVIGHLPTHAGKVFSHWSLGNQTTPITSSNTMADVIGHSQIYAIFDDAVEYVINVYDGYNMLGSFNTFNSSKLMSEYLNQITPPSHQGMMFKGYKYSYDDTDVDLSSTVGQASAYVSSNTIGVYVDYISVSSIVSIIYNGTEFGFTVDGDTLARVATTGQYDDLVGQPEIPEVNNNIITLTQGGIERGAFSLNQDSDETIELFSDGTFFESLSNTVYDSFGRLRSFTADSKTYTLTYEGGMLKTISNGTNTYTATYSGNLLVSVTKS